MKKSNTRYDVWSKSSSYSRHPTPIWALSRYGLRSAPTGKSRSRASETTSMRGRRSLRTRRAGAILAYITREWLKLGLGTGLYYRIVLSKARRTLTLSQWRCCLDSLTALATIKASFGCHSTVHLEGTGSCRPIKNILCTQNVSPTSSWTAPQTNLTRRTGASTSFG